MGNSKSKSTQAISNNTVNENYMNTVNKTIMESAVNTMVNNANTCSSAVNQINSCNFNNSSVAGNFNIGGTQSNTAKVDFSCINSSTTSANMASTMAATMMAEIKSLNGTEAANTLNNAATTSNKTGFGATGGSASATTNTSVSNNVTNQTLTHIENVFQHNLSNNFTTNTVNECIGKTTQSNTISASGVTVGGSANVTCNQSNSLEQVQECKQLSEAINTTVQKTFQELGLQTDATSQTINKTEAKSSATSENVATGPIQDIGNALSSLFDLASFAMFGPVIGPIISICSCILCLCLLFIIFQSFMGGSSDNNEFGGTDGIDGNNDFSGYNNFEE